MGCSYARSSMNYEILRKKNRKSQLQPINGKKEKEFVSCSMNCSSNVNEQQKLH